MAWGGYVNPWVLDLLPVPITDIMLTTDILDITLGLLIIFNIAVWIASAIAGLHLLGVLIVSGIDEITVRDIAILTSSLALAIETMPDHLRRRIGWLG